MSAHHSSKPNAGSGAMQSSVGNPQIYQADDQRTSKKPSKKPDELAYEEGQKNSHNLLDSKDQRSNANRLAAAEKKLKQEDRVSKGHEQEDPRMPAWRHGNEPSKGAKIDAQIQAEEREELERKGKI